MLDLQIEVGPVVGAYRICTTYKKTSDATKKVGGLRLQECQVAVSLALFGTAVTVVTSSTGSLKGHHE